MDIQSLQTELNDKHPKEILKSIYATGGDIAISFSGAEDVILIDMACKLGIKPRVFTLDTGRLHPETYRFMQTVMDHYQIKINVLVPDPIQLQQFTDTKGLFSFYTDGHKECCDIRKVAPLKKFLAGLSTWVTGQRRDQSSATRHSLNVVESDTHFSGPNKDLIKYNPLCHWSSEQVWTYIQALDVPFNPLHQQGFISIGCEPCTRATLPHQDPREGRWWWEDETLKECGLHAKPPTKP